MGKVQIIIKSIKDGIAHAIESYQYYTSTSVTIPKHSVKENGTLCTWNPDRIGSIKYDNEEDARKSFG